MNIIIDSQKTTECKQKLTEMYKEFYSKDGKCKYYYECKALCPEGINKGYDSSYAAKVGDWYSLSIDGTEIRIVIIGKEGIYKSDSVSAPARLSDWLNTKGGVNQHYRETYKMLCYIYNHSPKKPFAKQQGAVLKTFCLTNRFRCAFKKYSDDDTKAYNNEKQTLNCRKLLRLELDILKPTLIIIQNSNFKAKDIYYDKTIVDIKEGLCFLPENNCYVIETIHPRHFGLWHKTHFPLFKDNIDYLKEHKVLPIKEDYCNLFDEMENKCDL